MAALIDVDIRTVRRWADEGTLPPDEVRPGTHRRWRREDVDRFRRKHRLRPESVG